MDQTQHSVFWRELHERLSLSTIKSMSNNTEACRKGIEFGPETKLGNKVAFHMMVLPFAQGNRPHAVQFVKTVHGTLCANDAERWARLIYAVKDKRGYNALHLALFRTTPEMLHFFLDTWPAAAASSTWAANAGIESFLYETIVDLDDVVVRGFMIDAIASRPLGRRMLNYVAEDGSNILHAAVARRSRMLVVSIARHVPAALARAANGAGETPVDLADGCEEFLSALGCGGGGGRSGLGAAKASWRAQAPQLPKPSPPPPIKKGRQQWRQQPQPQPQPQQPLSLVPQPFAQQPPPTMGGTGVSYAAAAAAAATTATAVEQPDDAVNDDNDDDDSMFVMDDVSENMHHSSLSSSAASALAASDAQFVERQRAQFEMYAAAQAEKDRLAREAVQAEQTRLFREAEEAEEAAAAAAAAAEKARGQNFDSQGEQQRLRDELRDAETELYAKKCHKDTLVNQMSQLLERINAVEKETSDMEARRTWLRQQVESFAIDSLWSI
jgi:hypothetical protein